MGTEASRLLIVVRRQGGQNGHNVSRLGDLSGRGEGGESLMGTAGKGNLAKIDFGFNL